MSVRIDIADFIVIAAAATDDPDPAALLRVTNVPLAESALSAPYAGFGDTLFYDDPIHQAAILCSRIVRNHPLPDGNKRTGYLVLKYQLVSEGFIWSIPDEDDAVRTIRALAASTISETYFTQWVRSHVVLL